MINVNYNSTTNTIVILHKPSPEVLIVIAGLISDFKLFFQIKVIPTFKKFENVNK